MRQFAHLHISEGPDNRVVDRCQVHSTERPDKTSFHRRTVNVGIMHGCRILDQKLFQRFRIVGITVNQGFDQTGVFNPDDFVIVNWKFRTLKMKPIPFGFEFISPDITFIKH